MKFSFRKISKSLWLSALVIFCIDGWLGTLSEFAGLQSPLFPFMGSKAHLIGAILMMAAVYLSVPIDAARKKIEDKMNLRAKSELEKMLTQSIIPNPDRNYQPLFHNVDQKKFYERLKNFIVEESLNGNYDNYAADLKRCMDNTPKLAAPYFLPAFGRASTDIETAAVGLAKPFTEVMVTNELEGRCSDKFFLS